MSGPLLTFKRGSSFTATCTYVPPAGAAPNLIGAIISSQLRFRDTLLQEFTCTLAEDGMSFTVTADETDTTDWTVATCDWDIRIALGEDVIYTETMRLNVIAAVTREEAPSA